MRLPFYLRTGKAEATARAVLLERDAYEAKELDAIRETTKKVEELIEIFESIPDDTVPPSGRLWKEHYKWRLDQLLRERQDLPKESGKEYGALLEDLLERYTMRLPAVEHRETIRHLKRHAEEDRKRHQKILLIRSARLTEIVSQNQPQSSRRG